MKGNQGKNAGDIKNLVPRQVIASKPPGAPSTKPVNANPNKGGKGIKDISKVWGNVEKPPATPKAKTPKPHDDGFSFG